MKRLAPSRRDHRPQQPRRDLRHEPLHAQHPAELPLVRVVELGVARGGLLAVLPAVDDAAQLASQGDAEVERGADALGAERQAVAGRVAGEEDAALGAGAQLVRDPVALVADPVGVEVFGEQLGRLADVEARVEGADADAQLVAAPGRTSRSRPARSGGRSRSRGPRPGPRGGPRGRARAARRAAGSRRRWPACGASRARRRRAGRRSCRGRSRSRSSRRRWRAAPGRSPWRSRSGRRSRARAARRARGSRRWRR